MTIPTATGNAELVYEGNGTTTIFDIPFTFASAAEISVYLNGSAAAGVSIFGAGDPFGGTAVFAGAPASGAVVRIRRLQTLHVSGNDRAAGALAQKLVAGPGVTLTEQNDGGNETLQIAATALPDPAEVKVSSNDTTPGFLNGKLAAGVNIILTEENDGGDEILRIAAEVPTDLADVKVSANDATAGYLHGKLVAGFGIQLTEQNDGGEETLEIAVAGGAVPAGLVAPFAGAAAPNGWLLCDGLAVSRTTYAALFAVIGTAYGSGNGTTTFNLPDLRGRVAAGKDNMGGTAANRLTAASASGLDGSLLGAAGGNQQHQLTVAELASHRHYTGGDQVDTYSGTTAVLYSGTGPYATAYAGNDQPHNNTQPTLVLNYIIKA